MSTKCESDLDFRAAIAYTDRRFVVFQVVTMASNSKKTESIRKRRTRKMGKDRKRVLSRDGSTPVFPIHAKATEKIAG